MDEDGIWTCEPDGGAGRQKCDWWGQTVEAQAADSAAGAAWVGSGIGLTVGGALLAGAVVMSAARRPGGSMQPHQQALQQFQPQQHAGGFAPQQNYGSQGPR